MADIYCLSTSFISIEDDKADATREILERIEQQLEDDWGRAEFVATMENGSLWIQDDDGHFDPEHAEMLVRALVEELSLPPVVVSWAYTCSKPRPNDFGGGAFAVKKGFGTAWTDARVDVERILARDLM